MARFIDLIIIHCADTPNGRTLFTGKPGDKRFRTPVQEIDSWHRQRGFKRQDAWRRLQEPTLTSIGYHYVICLGGAVANGRHPDEIGAHAEGHNAHSIGICLIGKDAFTVDQWDSLRILVEQIRRKNPQAKVIGHHAVNDAKTCPNFDVQAWLDGGMKPLTGHVYVEVE